MNSKRNKLNLIMMIAVILICQMSIVSCNDKDVVTYPPYTGDGWMPDGEFISTEETQESPVPPKYDETIELITPDVPENGECIQITSEEDMYALGRIFSPQKTKADFFGDNYDISNDLDRFEIPDDIIDVESKITYLSSASYMLTKDMVLTMQVKNDTTFFLGIGSVEYPFGGVFDGNEKTITLKANENISLDANTNPNIGLFSDAEGAQLLNVNVDISSDILVNRCVEIVKFGLLAGSTNDCLISDCNIEITGAKVGVDFAKGEKYVNQAWVGGVVGECNFSVIQSSNVVLNDGTVYASGYDVDMPVWYANFSVGGIVGFSKHGSDNTVNIGRIGNRLLECKVISKNSEQRDVIYASIESGTEVDAGGIIGCTFNNFVAKKCSVDISKGNITAQKTGTSDNSKYGTNSGGIIGRLEHTGELYLCNVKGDYLNIISKSPENFSTAGGIVGWDVGPYHRDVISINACSFDGCETSKIILDIYSDNSKKIWNALGGVAGVSNYQIANCSVQNVILENCSKKVEKCYAGGICGIFGNKSGLWTNNEYFTPKKPDIINCMSKNLVFNTTSNVKANETCPVTQ